MISGSCESLEHPGEVHVAGPRCAAARGVSKLHVADQVGVLFYYGNEILAVVGEVKGVEKQTDVVCSGPRHAPAR